MAPYDPTWSPPREVPRWRSRFASPQRGRRAASTRVPRSRCPAASGAGSSRCRRRARSSPDDEPAHPRPSPWVVVHVDDVDVTRRLQRPRQLEHGVGSRRGGGRSRPRRRTRRPRGLLQERLLLDLGRGATRISRSRNEGALGRLCARRPPREWRRSRSASCRSSRRSVAPRAPARARRTPRSTRASRAGRRCGLRRDWRARRWAGPRAACPCRPSARSRERGLQAGAVVRADRGDVQIGERRGCLLPPYAAERLRVLVEGHHGDDQATRRRGQRRSRCQAPSRSWNVSTMNRSTASPSSSLACSAKTRRLASRLADLAERPDRPRDEHVPTGNLARVARDLHTRLVDSRELVLEVVLGELCRLAPKVLVSIRSAPALMKPR